MSVLVQDVAESITSMDVEAVDSVRLDDRFGNWPKGRRAVQPPVKLAELARYGTATHASTLRRPAEPRWTATLLATVRHLTGACLDDPLTLATARCAGSPAWATT